MKQVFMTVCILTGMLAHAFSQDYNLRVWQFKPGEKANQTPAQILLDAYKLPAPYGALPLESPNKEKNGKQVYRLQQTYGGIPVDHAVALVHVKNGQPERVIANWPEKPVDIPIVPRTTVERAVKAAIAATKAKDAKVHKNPKGQEARLLLWRAPDRWFLAYEIFVEIEEPFDERRILVDALTEVVLQNHSTGHNCCTPANALLNYNGNQTIVTDAYTSGDYRLRACVGASGAGDCTTPVGNFRTVKNLSLTDFTNNSTNWTGFALNTAERCALDAHWGTQVVFDYYLNGSTMAQNIFYGAEMTNIIDNSLTNNAIYYSNSNRIRYGHTQGTQQYLTSLDIVAHELTHQATFYNSGLIYQGESGAINEALSDIFATAIEQQYGYVDWLIGNGFNITPRSLSNPSAFGQPDTYGGFNWESGSVDNGGVHTNSGVINHWFFLLANGGLGTNDLGNAYDVQGIGMANAMELVSLLQSDYLTPTTDMHEMRELALIAAGELWYYCSENYIAVVEAFYAVGIGEPFDAHSPIEETWETDITSCSVQLHWEDVGAEKYLIRVWEVNNPSQNFFETSLVNNVTILNLSPNTLYEWEVFSQCEDYVIPTEHTDTFTTINDCPALTGLAVSDITTCSAEISWDYNSASQFQIDYQVQGSGNITTIFATESPVIINQGLLAGTVYDVFVTPICGDQCTGTTDSLKFMTEDCIELQNLKIDNNPCYFTINWDIQESQTYEITMTYIDPFWPIPIQYPTYSDFFGSYSFLHSFFPGTILQFEIVITCTGDDCETQTVQHFEFVVPEPSDSCEAPTNISVQYFPGGGRVISWDGPANGNGYYRLEITSSDGTVETDYVYGNKYVTSGGAPHQCITIRVQAICGCEDPTTTSEWAEQEVCPPCESPVEMHVIYQCSDYMAIGFTGPFNGLGYRARYWPASNPTDITTITPDMPYYFGSFSMDNLAPNTTYIVELTTLCDDGVTSAPLYFEVTTDPAECVVPANVSYEIIGNGHVRLDWTATPGADYYEVRYRMGSAATPWTTLQVFDNYVEINGLDLTGCFVYTMQVRAICSECSSGRSNYTSLFYFPECMPEGIHIGTEAGQTCDPCLTDCYVCIVDGQGKKINSLAAAAGFWYRITWSVPAGYPTPGYQLNNRECINMGPAYHGQTFTAVVRKMCTVNGYETEVCQMTLTYTHDCTDGGEGGEGGDGGTTIGGGHLADGSGANAQALSGENLSCFVYPNPGTNDCNLVNRSATDYQGVVMDAYGRNLKTIEVNANGTVVIATTDWPAGVYYVLVKTRDGVYTQTLKWVKL